MLGSKPSGMEMMAANLLRAMGIDPEKLTKEFTTRIEQFEAGLKTLNDTLHTINARLDRIEQRQLVINALLASMQEGKPASDRPAIEQRTDA